MENDKSQTASEGYFREGKVTHVMQMGFKPPCYKIFPTYEGLKYLIPSLGGRAKSSERFYSIMVAGGDYAQVVDSSYKKYQEYTVEIFGLLMPAANYSGSTKLADSRQYALKPKYWHQSPSEVVQIWRLRVFHSSSEVFNPSPQNPLTPLRPTFPYVEEIWRPDLPAPSVLVGGLERFFPGFSVLNHFHSRARKILFGFSTDTGRPKGSGRYENWEDFYRELKGVYRELATTLGRKPAQKEVAFRMNLKLNSFREYWKHGGFYWHYLYDFVMEKSENPISQSNS